MAGAGGRDPLAGDAALPSGSSAFERLALRANTLAERWMPDAFVFALVATVLVLIGALAVDPAARGAPVGLVDAWGKGFWVLIPFTLQMSMIIIGGYVLASAPPVRRLLRALAGLPQSGKGAAAFVALAAMLTSLLNWGFSLIFSALLAKEVARRRPEADYRTLAAAGFLGLGTVWAQGLSGSAALYMASPGSMPEALKKIAAGGIPLTETIFLPASLACVLIEVVVVTALMWAIAPSTGKGAAALGIDLGPSEDPPLPAPRVPGEWLEHRPWALLPVVAVGVVFLVRGFTTKATSLSAALGALDFNTINLFFLLAGALLHWTPASLARAFKEATPAVWGVLLQFPFYGGIYGVMTETKLSSTIASWFVHAADATLYPAFVVAYSLVLGIFVPSGGSKWVIEAPYVLEAARTLGVADGWVVVCYDLGEAVANLLQPFWMLPILALLGLRARDVMGTTYVVAMVLIPLVFLLVTVFAPQVPA